LTDLWFDVAAVDLLICLTVWMWCKHSLVSHQLCWLLA